MKIRTNRRKLEENTIAVSAVIGVILMVAVTVAMAAVAYAYFTGMIGGGEETTPIVEFIQEELTDKIIAQTAEEDADWSRLYMYVEDTPSHTIKFHFNGAVTQSDTALGVGSANAVQIISTPTSVSAGDYIKLGADGGAASQVTIVIIDRVSNVILKEFKFREIAAI
jgi:hypothetical protein